LQSALKNPAFSTARVACFKGRAKQERNRTKQSKAKESKAKESKAKQSKAKESKGKQRKGKQSLKQKIKGSYEINLDVVYV
jgi:hypothetical protein